MCVISLIQCIVILPGLDIFSALQHVRGQTVIDDIRDIPDILQIARNHTYTNVNTSDCFDSPFVLCTKRHLLKARKPVKTVNTSKAETIKTVFVTSLVPKSTSEQLFNFKHCPQSCEVIPRHKINEATGVFVDGTSVTEKHFPKTRSIEQIYFLFGLESPIHLRGTILHADFKYKDWINLTMTYRVDSSIPLFYNRLCLNDAPQKTDQELRKMYDGKTRMAAWFVSNCKTQSKRMAFVKELKKHIDVDIYGKCGNRSYPNLGPELKMLTRSYKFYLAFENSFCKDYVTEKFFKLFSPDVYIVPVVRGGMDYDRYFPPHTFINVEHFKTPADLGAHLKDVGEHFEKYAKYLKKKDKYVTQPPIYRRIEWMCAICSALHKGGGTATSRYSNISQYISEGICFEPKDHYEIHSRTKQKPLVKNIH